MKSHYKYNDTPGRKMMNAQISNNIEGVEKDSDGRYRSLSKDQMTPGKKMLGTQVSNNVKKIYKNKDGSYSSEPHKNKTEFNGFPEKIYKDKDGRYSSEPLNKNKNKTEFNGFPKSENVYKSKKHDAETLTPQDAEDVAMDLEKVIDYMNHDRHQDSRWGKGTPFFKSNEAKKLNHTYTRAQQIEMEKIGNIYENGLNGVKMGSMPNSHMLTALARRVISAEGLSQAKKKEDERAKQSASSGALWSTVTEDVNYFPY